MTAASHVSVGRVRYEPGFRQATHTDDRVQISVVLKGSLVERVGRREAHAGPLGLVVKARGVEHADDYGASGVLIGSLALEGDEGERLLDAGASFPAWRWSHGSPALRPLLRLVDRVAGARSALDADDADVLDVLALVSAPPPPEVRGLPPAWLARVRERFDDGERPRLGIAAAQAGVHPVYLARAFRRWFGCSVSTYLSRARVGHAARLLASPGTPLTHVALTAGFSDHAHLCRRFKEATGLTPSRYRALAAPARPAVEVPPR